MKYLSALLFAVPLLMASSSLQARVIADTAKTEEKRSIDQLRVQLFELLVKAGYDISIEQLYSLDIGSIEDLIKQLCEAQKLIAYAQCIQIGGSPEHCRLVADDVYNACVNPKPVDPWPGVSNPNHPNINPDLPFEPFSPYGPHIAGSYGQ